MTYKTAQKCPDWKNYQNICYNIEGIELKYENKCTIFMNSF